jgi:hypothetical protein
MKMWGFLIKNDWSFESSKHRSDVETLPKARDWVELCIPFDKAKLKEVITYAAT